MAPALLELKAFLKDTPFFGGLTDASLDILIPLLVERFFDVGDIVVREGEAGRSMFIVRSGELAVTTQTATARSLRLNTLKAGDFFGEMTLIAMENRSASVVVERRSVLLEISARSLYAFYKADVHAYVLILQNINRELCRRLRHADGRVVSALDEKSVLTASMEQP